MAVLDVVVGTHDGPLGLLPGTGKGFALPLCEMWHFGSSGWVVGGDLYYDQVSLLTQLGLMPQPSCDGTPRSRTRRSGTPARTSPWAGPSSQHSPR
jgi:hypothetical protein